MTCRERETRIGPVSRIVVLERDGWRCYLCACDLMRGGDNRHPRAATIDHVVPLSRGGTHTYANLRACCRACNNAKGASVREAAHG